MSNIATAYGKIEEAVEGLRALDTVAAELNLESWVRDNLLTLTVGMQNLADKLPTWALEGDECIKSNFRHDSDRIMSENNFIDTVSEIVTALRDYEMDDDAVALFNEFSEFLNEIIEDKAEGVNADQQVINPEALTETQSVSQNDNGSAETTSSSVESDDECETESAPVADPIEEMCHVETPESGVKGARKKSKKIVVNSSLTTV